MKKFEQKIDALFLPQGVLQKIKMPITVKNADGSVKIVSLKKTAAVSAKPVVKPPPVPPASLRHLSDNKKFLLGRMMPHDRFGMLPFVWLSEGAFTVIALFKGNDWFLYGACKEYEYNDMPEPKMLTQAQFDTVAKDNPSKNLTWELYRMMYKAEAEYKDGE